MQSTFSNGGDIFTLLACLFCFAHAMYGRTTPISIRMIHYVPARLRITQAAQVVLEKRLGIAQLCFLLAVLLFVGLALQGAPAQHPPTWHRSTREWGVRNLGFWGSTDTAGTHSEDAVVVQLKRL